MIELVVSIGIIAMLLGMTFMLTGRQQRGAQVRREAELLAGTLRQARNMAMSNRAIYAVVFHIQNAPGSSGAVLNNRSGGHFYRILGPVPSAGTVNSAWFRSTTDLLGRIPYAGGGTNFPEFLIETQTSWIDEPHVLPAGKVRFLALGDTDEGPALRNHSLTAVSGRSPIHYGSGGETTYPRPWFGYFDATSGTLWPWGGYDPSKTYSGFFYQGKDGPIVGSVNPTSRTYNNDFDRQAGVPTTFQNVDRNGDGDFDDAWEREVDIPILTAGEPRALVNSDWLDAGIAFFPDGSARYLEWNRSRRYYLDMQANLTHPGGAFPQPKGNANGVRDMSKICIAHNPAPSSYGGGTLFTSISEGTAYGIGQVDYDIPEVGHFDRHTGGWHVTMAPDVPRDQTSFPSAKAAMSSIMPAHRVFVGRNGSIATFAVKQPEGFLYGKNIWPTNPDDWLSTSSSPSGNPVWQHCRIAFLHQPNTSTGANSAATLVPRGTPIVDVVTPEMMTNRVWWLDD